MFGLIISDIEREVNYGSGGYKMAVVKVQPD